MSRGMMLNNPFNIEKTDIHWLGKCYLSADPTFEQFDTMEHGLRAGFKDLLAAFNEHKRTTIKTIVTAYAPPEENDTDAYCAAVCKYTGYGENDQVNLNDLDTLILFGHAFIIQEQGDASISAIGEEIITEAAIDALGVANSSS